MTRILVVEDDPRVGELLQRGLGRAGYAVELVDDGEEARLAAVRDTFDLIILDMGLPGRDGLLVLKDLRAAGVRSPVLVLTGMAERDVVTCLDEGADDYLRKPFRFDELLARCRTRLRASEGTPSTVLQAGRVSLDLRTRRASVDGGTVDLTGREFALLETFLRHPEQVLSREQLLSQVWGYDFDPRTNVVNVYVNVLRNKLGHDLLETVRGVGYRLRAR